MLLRKKTKARPQTAYVETNDKIFFIAKVEKTLSHLLKIVLKCMNIEGISTLYLK